MLTSVPDVLSNKNFASPIADGFGTSKDDRGTLPSRWYADDEIYSLEQKLIFRRAWDYVGHKGQVQKPGDFFTCESAGVPIVVACAEDGIIRAFLNICRHRHNAVAVGSGNCRLFMCHYHAWVYRLDGSFRSAPRSKEDSAFDGSGLSLSPVAIDFLGSMIFVNPTADAPPLRDVLGPIPELAVEKGVPLHQSVFREVRAIEIDANWKLSWDNNSECYHCPTIHKSWYQEANLGPQNICSFPIGPYHFQHVMNTRDDAPEDNHFFCWPTFTLATDSSSGPGFNQRASGLSEMGHLGFFMWRWIPLSARKTRVEFHLFTEKVIEESVVNAWFDALLQVMHEDKEICESVQASHDSGMCEPGTLITAIDSEYQIHTWNRLVHRALTQPKTPLYAPLLERSTTWPTPAAKSGLASSSQVA